MPVARSQVERWLHEDLGHHDVTNEVPGETTGRLVAKESGVAAGLEAAVAVFDHLGVGVETHADPGDRIESGDTVLTADGAAREVLRGERVAVNVAGHASGVATRTREAVDAAREVSDGVRIAGTRKTTPGLRGVEKRAIVAGGGDTHRLDLSHMVMVKDNHVAEMGLEDAVSHFRERASFATKIEVEVERPAEGRRAAEAGADIVLFDNLAPAAVSEGVEALPAGVLAEASGGITLDTVPEYAATGVDVISLGSLTHSAPAFDYSFRTG
ncbi:carboxylating nicotinate-nucleotide diphosphorylase [Halococcus salifodinae]|uniref:Nicotinate-nucleotide pyrophosphorylase [carboxylating] n=1 Tax=Halococcus salifodinae DSM 8989 TaxID=1227456 RepID=M0MX02_9EURY|nr:carboxylating nicotinate-nucleotide diphosphorylase [Halococcus salifodinae]EMA49853.1 nicotinate-nucleotide pyrophosphorylase [Halococcus salifodinae DSM 8989]